MHKKRNSWLSKLQNAADKPSFFALLFLISLVDYFTVLIPVDLFLAMGILVRPTKWIKTALTMSIGSTLGALAIAGLVLWSPHVINDYFISNETIGADAWKTISGFVREYGGLAVFVSAIIPIPQHPTLVIATVCGLPIEVLGPSFFAGRIIKFFGLAYLTASSPQVLLNYFPGFKRKLVRMGYEFSTGKA